jgi:hypothetical protein
MFPTLQKVAAKVMGILFVGVGALAGKRFVTDIFSGTQHEPVTTFTFALGMIALGGFYLWYVDKGYRGGAPTIIGAFFLVVGAFSLAGVIDARAELSPYQVFLNATAGLMLLGFGVLLIRSGHQSHLACRSSGATQRSRSQV